MLLLLHQIDKPKEKGEKEMNVNTMTNNELYNNFVENTMNGLHEELKMTVETFWNIFYLPHFRGREEA